MTTRVATVTRAAVTCVLLCAGAGCAGASMDVSADGITQPVSFTPAVFLSDGSLYVTQPEDVVRRVEVSRSAWSVLWKAVRFGTTDWDLGADLAAELEQGGGDAVVNLKVEASSDWWWLIGTLIPILPSCIDVTAEADIIRVPELD